MSIDLFEVINCTWPADQIQRRGNFLVRQGAGGGKRVSAVSLEGEFNPSDFEMVESESLFSVRDDQKNLDTFLRERDFKIVDPSILFSCPIEILAGQNLPRVSAFPIWPSLEIMNEIWLEGGIGPERRAVMDRACAPKTGILGRINDRAAATAFVSIHKNVAMVHALEVSQNHRRLGLGKLMMIAAAKWGTQHGAKQMALVTTRENTASISLYQSLGMALVDGYHYRMRST